MGAAEVMCKERQCHVMVRVRCQLRRGVYIYTLAGHYSLGIVRALRTSGDFIKARQAAAEEGGALPSMSFAPLIIGVAEFVLVCLVLNSPGEMSYMLLLPVLPLLPQD